MSDWMLIEVDRKHRAGHGRWWRPNGAGYTDLLACAGLYAPEEALDRVRGCEGKMRARPLAQVVDDVLGDSEWMAHHGVGFDRVAAPGTVGELLADLDILGQIRRAILGTTGILTSLYRAVQYVLDRAQEDPDLGYQVGPGSEAFRLLCVAEAAHLEQPLEQVERERRQDLQPEHRRRRARVVELDEEVQQLRALVHPAQELVRAHRKGWTLDSAALDLGEALEEAGREPGRGGDDSNDEDEEG